MMYKTHLTEFCHNWRRLLVTKTVKYRTKTKLILSVNSLAFRSVNQDIQQLSIQSNSDLNRLYAHHAVNITADFRITSS